MKSIKSSTGKHLYYVASNEEELLKLQRGEPKHTLKRPGTYQRKKDIPNNRKATKGRPFHMEPVKVLSGLPGHAVAPEMVAIKSHQKIQHAKY